MIKKLLSLIVLFEIFQFNAQAFAEVAVGDRVVYEGIQNKMPFTLTSYITKSAGEKIWVVHTIQDYLGKIVESDTTSQVISRRTIQNILTGCESMGGVSETVTTKAGKFKTCRLARENSPSVWIGDVPFGLVKEENHEVGLDTFAEISSYYRAQP